MSILRVEIDIIAIVWKDSWIKQDLWVYQYIWEWLIWTLNGIWSWQSDPYRNPLGALLFTHWNDMTTTKCYITLCRIVPYQCGFFVLRLLPFLPAPSAAPRSKTSVPRGAAEGLPITTDSESSWPQTGPLFEQARRRCLDFMIWLHEPLEIRWRARVVAATEPLRLIRTVGKPSSSRSLKPNLREEPNAQLVLLSLCHPFIQHLINKR